MDLDDPNFDFDLPHKPPKLNQQYKLVIYESAGARDCGIALFRNGYNHGRVAFHKKEGNHLLRALKATIDLSVTIQKLEVRTTKKGYRVIAGKAFLDIAL